VAHRTSVFLVPTNAQAAAINLYARHAISNITTLPTQQVIVSAAPKTVSAAAQAHHVPLA
jgi:hypothetical protein